MSDHPFVFSGKNKGWKKSNQICLAEETANSADRVARVLLAKIEDPLTDTDVLDSLCISYCEIQKTLMEILRRNFWRGTKKIRKPKKKKGKFSDLLKSPL